MKKKCALVIFTALLVVLVTGCGTKSNTSKENPIDIIEGTPLLEFDEYKNFDFNNVASLTILKYTEGGVNEEEVTDMEEIQRDYNGLRKITVLNESKRACEDNTTIYRYNMKDGTKYAFEFECEWLVIGSKRYTYK